MDETNRLVAVRQTPNMGRGVFAVQPIARGTCLVVCKGWRAKTDAVAADCHAMQIGPDDWLCSAGDHLDDCINHSCEPNAGFVTGEPALFALRDIKVGEQIAWDYSTSIAEAGWTLECRCQSPRCRKLIRSWLELTSRERERLAGIALLYLREIQ
jgi:hypothetical protein